MANVGSLFVALILDSARYTAGLSDVTKKTNKTAQAIQKEIKGMVNFAVGAGGFYAVVRGIKAVTSAAAEQEEATFRLSQTLRNSYQFTTMNLKALEDQAGALQKVTRYGDEMITSAQSQLMAISKLDTQGVKKLTPSLLDFATAMRMDLVSAAELVGKAFTEGRNPLKIYGIEVDKTWTATQKLDNIISQLQANWGDQSKVGGFTTSMAQLKNAISDVNEELGFMITGRAGGVMQFWAEKISDAANSMKEARETLSYYEANLPGESPAGLTQGWQGGPPGTPYWTTDQKARAKVKADEYELFQQKVNRVRAANALPVTDSDALDKDIEKAKNHSMQLMREAATIRNRIAAADKEALAMFQEDAKAWRQTISDYSEAIADSENRYSPFSQNNETTSEGGMFEQFILDSEKAQEEMERNRGELIAFSNQFSTVLSNSAMQSGNVFSNIANNFGRMLEVMAADLAAKSAIFGVLSIFAPGLMGGAGLVGKGGFMKFLGIPGFAGGGMVGARKPILVGERGPEIFTPSSAGRIIPNNQIDQSRISVVFNGSPGDLRSKVEMVRWMREAWRDGELKFLAG